MKQKNIQDDKRRAQWISQADRHHSCIWW